MPFEEVEHTADMALRIWAPDLPGLFIEAARGMFSLMAGATVQGDPTGWQRVHLQAIDYESLLVEWLNELLFLAEEGDRLFVEFRVEHLSSAELEAQAGWIRGKLTGAHIKAATYHNLFIQHTEHQVEVELTLDV
jgi:SHS2 domain-containing protein